MAERGYRGFGIRKRPAGAGRHIPDPPPERVTRQLERAEAVIAEPFVGITTDGRRITGLFPLEQTGLSTAPLKDAADAFINTLSTQQRDKASFAIDSPQWRLWQNNASFALRHGVGLEGASAAERTAALNLVQVSLSARGFQAVRTTMKLNELLSQITGNTDELGEWLYWLSIFGTPSLAEPWGWQLDGHHLAVSCFVLGDQMVLTPSFLGAEPNYADRGPDAGLRAFAEEERQGLELIRALSPAQQQRAILYASMLSKDLPRERNDPNDGRVWAGAFHDNRVIPYEGIGGAELSAGQRDLLRRLMEVYVGRVRQGHDKVNMAEVDRRLDQTHFSWIGGTDDDSVFYYRVHSPVILIEFDHHHGVFLDNDEPEKFHIHTVVRTPNGNDYGRDLLRQHYEKDHRPTTQ